MDPKRLHIVSFTVPWPADFGGVIDVFHKIRHLHALGWKIDLHCFTYDRPPAAELEQYVESVHYYHRQRSPHLLLSRLPYIVASRKNKRLKDHLLGDNNPILFEGLHCTHSLLGSPDLGKRAIVRTHNIEHAYYRMLAEAEHSRLKSAYFRFEASKLEYFEGILSHCCGLASISETDLTHFKQLNARCELVFPFHAFDSVTVPVGLGEYSLFHGAMHVAENHRAALWLVSEVAPRLNHPLVIAGKGIQASLRKKAAAMNHVRFVESPSDAEMDGLIRGAQSHLLPAFAQAGMRLKLLHALFCGRHVITNRMMLNGTQLHSYCIVAETAEDFILEAHACHTIAFDKEKAGKRMTIETSPYSNLANAHRISRLLESADCG